MDNLFLISLFLTIPGIFFPVTEICPSPGYSFLSGKLFPAREMFYQRGKAFLTGKRQPCINYKLMKQILKRYNCQASALAEISLIIDSTPPPPHTITWHFNHRCIPNQHHMQTFLFLISHGKMTLQEQSLTGDCFENPQWGKVYPFLEKNICEL